MKISERHLPLFTAFIGGLVSMGLEIVAAREVHPVFGSSVFVWGSILTVFMTALGLGYYIGGKRAEESASKQSLARLLLWVAVIISLIAVLSERILNATFTLDIPIRYRSIPAIALLFGPPAFFVGCISPFAAEIEGELVGTGDAAGRVYAAGTIGSVLGASGTTFVLLPFVGTTVSYILFTTLLLLGVGLLMIATHSWTHQKLTVIAVSLLLIQVALFSGVGESVVYQTETEYHNLEVRDSGGVRTLYLNGNPNSAEYLNGSDKYVFDYAKALHLPTLYQQTPSGDNLDVLVIGGGAGTVSERYAEEYNASVDVVEIDAETARVANKYFNTSHPNVNWHIQDGRTFLKQTTKNYDVIILDAYQNYDIPYHLTTVEFFRLVESRLTTEGVFVANIIGSKTGDDSDIYKSEIATTKQVFTYVDSYQTQENPDTFQNLILIGGNGIRPSNQTLRMEATTSQQKVPTTKFLPYRQHGEKINLSGVQILRDDKGSTPSLKSPLP